MNRLYKTILSLTISAALFTSLNTNAQSSSGESLDINNINAMLHVTGDHFWDLIVSPKFEVPKGSNKHTIFASALWIGGYNNNRLHQSAMTYRQSGSDFSPGPLDTSTGDIWTGIIPQWDKMWRISGAEIEAFRNDKSKVTDAIKTWPAHGDANFSQAKYLAPFVDVDKDGVYDHTKGDYPKIKGDQAIWWIFNDRNSEHAETGGQALGVEIHAMAYAFSSANNTLNNTIFFEYDIINRSKNNYKDLYTGLWTDFDLGYGMDDAIGCDSTLSAYFSYNSDDFDDGVFGYGNHTPVQSVVFLKDSMKNFISYNNDFTSRGNPDNPTDFYNYLTARYRDGKPVVNPKTNRPTKFAYSGNPLDTSGWISEKNESDKRGVGSIGPINLKSRAKHKFTFAYVTSYVPNGTVNDNLQIFKNDISTVKTYYQEHLNTGISGRNQFTDIQFKVYPNPTQDFINLQWNNADVKNVRLINMLGQVVLQQQTDGAQTQFQLKVKHFPKGVYMIVAENNLTSAVQRIVLE